MDLRNEKSSFCLTISLTDKNGQPLEAISSLTWWVGKPRGDTPIVTVQTVANPTAEEEIVIPASANICSGTKNEQRVVIIKVQSGSYIKHTTYEYEIKALPLVPYPA